MALIVRGSSIGVKFLRRNNEEYCSHPDSTGQFCIHNGRFMYAVIGGVEAPSFDTSNINRVQVIVFDHAGRCRNNQPVFQPISVFNVVDVRLIPAFNYTYRDFMNPGRYVNVQGYCRDTRPGSDYYNAHRNDVDKILPTMPIAFCYRRSNGRTDVHNGRYMYWQDTALNRHCVLRLTDSPYRIWYSHMIFDASGNLTPELRYRGNILGFSKIPL